MTKITARLILAAGITLCGFHASTAQEPPPVNPFASTNSQRDDAIPGYIELSDGSIHPGQIYLTRDKRLKIADDKAQRQREVPLSAVKQITCTVKKEWMEKEWKFKELTKDEKMFTGRSYPAAEYEHAVTLNDGQTITGSLSAIVYLQPGDNSPRPSTASPAETKSEQFLLNKRNKGEIGQDLHSLIYVKSIKLGKDALAEGLNKSAEHKAKGR
jgi:hypothetical protein